MNSTWFGHIQIINFVVFMHEIKFQLHKNDIVNKIKVWNNI
jgi:hypothetical protein